MELSRRCKEYWGFRPSSIPFANRIEAVDGLFIWDEFADVVDRMIDAVKRRRFLVVAGAACSSKSTAWNETKRRLQEGATNCHICQPMGLDPAAYYEQTIYRTLKYTLEPPDDSRDKAFRRMREDRAHQCRLLLERSNEAGTPVVLTVNDAHACRLPFLICCKRLWDDLFGFDRLLAVILIGHAPLLVTLSGCREINERSEVVQMPGLGEAVEPYLHHEFSRCGATEFPLDDSAVQQLGRLRRPNWRESRDHPLVVNNIVSRALYEAWRIKSAVVTADHIVEAMRAEA